MQSTGNTRISLRTSSQRQNRRRQSNVAQCIKCGAKVGFFSQKNLRSGKGPFCKTCFVPYTAFFFTWIQQSKKSDADPQSAAWVALCHLVCAERVNVVRETKHAIGMSLEKEETWKESKKSAVEYAQKALSLLPTSSPGHPFVSALLQRAQRIAGPSANVVGTQTMSTQVSLFDGSTDYVIDQWAIIAGGGNFGGSP